MIVDEFVYYEYIHIDGSIQNLARQAGQLIPADHFDAVGRFIILRKSRTTEAYTNQDIMNYYQTESPHPIHSDPFTEQCIQSQLLNHVIMYSTVLYNQLNDNALLSTITANQAGWV